MAAGAPKRSDKPQALKVGSDMAGPDPDAPRRGTSFSDWGHGVNDWIINSNPLSKMMDNFGRNRPLGEGMNVPGALRPKERETTGQINMSMAPIPAKPNAVRVNMPDGSSAEIEVGGPGMTPQDMLNDPYAFMQHAFGQLAQDKQQQNKTYLGIPSDPNAVDAMGNPIGGSDPNFRAYTGQEDIPGAQAARSAMPQNSADRSLTPTSRHVTVAPRYTPTDPMAQLQRLSPEARLAIQNQLSAAGFNVETDGRIDQSTIDALTAVMANANQNGVKWRESLNAMEKAAVDAKTDAARAAWETAKSSYIRDPFLAPSYETMAQTVKDQMRKQLGREPKEYEMELLSEELSNGARAAFEQQADIDEAGYLAKAAAGINAEVGSEIIDAPGMPADGTEAVDPMANFGEAFDRMFGEEINQENQEDIHAQTSQRVIQGLTSIDGMFR